MHALLQLAPGQVHLCDYPLDSHQLIRHPTIQAPRGHEIGPQVSIKGNPVMINFGQVFATFFLMQVLL